MNLKATVDDAIHCVPVEESEHALDVQRIDDEQGAFVCLSCRNEDGGDFFAAFSLENAARLGEILRALTADQRPVRLA